MFIEVNLMLRLDMFLFGTNENNIHNCVFHRKKASKPKSILPCRLCRDFGDESF